MKKYSTFALMVVGFGMFMPSAQAWPFGWGTSKQLLVPPIVQGLPNDGLMETPKADPLESLNRATYAFNKGFDRILLKPAALAYKNVVPALARQGVGNMLAYLHTPLDVANYALQGNGDLSGNAMGRLLLNTFGLGIFDIASDAGISRKQTGFGETFGVWGAPQGPYVVLPLLGGRSIRGTAGSVGDAQLGVAGQLNTPERATALVLDALDTRVRLLGAENIISGAALDEYSFVRDALMQREGNRVEELKE